MEASAVMFHLENLVRNVPDFGGRGVAPRDGDAVLKWSGKLDAILGEIGDLAGQIEVRSSLGRLNSSLHETGARSLLGVLYRTIAAAELKLPASAKGAFIPVGHAFDALAAVAEIIGEAKGTLMLVDPYLSEKVLTTYCIMAHEGVALHLLVSEKKCGLGCYRLRMSGPNNMDQNGRLSFGEFGGPYFTIALS